MTSTTPPPARLLTGDALRALSRRSDARGALRLAVHLALIAGAGALVAIAPGWWTLPAMLVLGIAQVTLFAPLHETMHLTAFASRRANAVVGWLVACPSLLNWHYYAQFHLAHHRHTQDKARDPELNPPPPAGLGDYVRRVLGVNYWRARLQVLADAWRGDLSGYSYISAAHRPRIVLSLRAMTVAVLAAALAAGLAFGWQAPLVYWIGPQLLAQPLLRLYLLTEHTGCAESADGLANTRTTLTNPIIRLLMWNMGFHAEHHLYPSIPFHRLAEAHRALRPRLGVVQPGYARWHWAYFKSLAMRSA